MVAIKEEFRGISIKKDKAEAFLAFAWDKNKINKVIFYEKCFYAKNIKNTEIKFCECNEVNIVKNL